MSNQKVAEVHMLVRRLNQSSRLASQVHILAQVDMKDFEVVEPHNWVVVVHIPLAFVEHMKIHCSL